MFNKFKNLISDTVNTVKEDIKSSIENKKDELITNITDKKDELLGIKEPELRYFESYVAGTRYYQAAINDLIREMKVNEIIERNPIYKMKYDDFIKANPRNNPIYEYKAVDLPFLLFEYEKRNQHDAKAIKVMASVDHENWYKIGYVPVVDRPIWQQALNSKNKKFTATLLSGNSKYAFDGALEKEKDDYIINVLIEYTK